MVVFLIPVAVVGYKFWEKRRREEEEEESSQQQGDNPETTECNVVSSAEVSLPESSASTPTSAEATPFQKQQNALLRSWARLSGKMDSAEQSTSRESYGHPNELENSKTAAEAEASLLRSWSRPSEENAVVVAPLTSS